MNTIQKHLEDELKNSAHYELTFTDKEFVKTQGIENYIFWKLTSKHFRKWKLSQDCIDRTKKAINLCVSKNKELEIGFFMGGYKLWRLPSTPKADWAEFFNIAYLLSYIAPIAAAYKPGVKLFYYIHTLLMEKHDNLTTEEINSYVDSFQKLVELFKTYLPKNMTIKIIKDADIYSREEYFQTLDEGFKISSQEFPKLPIERQEQLKKFARLNIKWAGKENWEKLTQEEREKKIIKGATYELAIFNLKKVNAVVKADNQILLFTVPTASMIGVGSTKSSVAKFWVGYGVLEKIGEKIRDLVLSPSQFEQLKLLPHETIEISHISLKNFKTVWVYNQSIDFSR